MQLYRKQEKTLFLRTPKTVMIKIVIRQRKEHWSKFLCYSRKRCLGRAWI